LNPPRVNALKTKAAKTKKNQRLMANRPQHKDKNDFLAWKESISPLGCD
jgi:hypothetical protein